MLASTTKYGNGWIDNHRTRVPWLNQLIAQPIPEESDVIDCPIRIRADSECSSSSSIEEFYTILEIQRPHLTNQRLNFAQINEEDVHYVEYDQLVEPMIIEIPSKENAVEYQSEQMIMNKEHVKMTQLHIHKPNKSSDNSSVSTSKKSILETATLTRTYTFDRQHMDKSDRGKEHEINSSERHNEEQSILSKPSTLLRLAKKCTRIVKSEYYLTNDEIKTNEPTLLQVKYFDGRPTLTNFDALESIEKSQILRTSISSRLNLSKNSIMHDFSYGKRLLNRVQTFIKSPSNDQTKPWQQKTLFGILNEIKNKK